jgi:hypothetical protein
MCVNGRRSTAVPPHRCAHNFDGFGIAVGLLFGPGAGFSAINQQYREKPPVTSALYIPRE